MIYIAAMSAKRIEGAIIRTAITPAISASPCNDEEAEGHFLVLARERWPVQDGWHGHVASIYAVPPDAGYSWTPKTEADD